MYKFLLTIFILTQFIYADCLNSSIPVTNENIQKTLQCFQDEINRLKKASSVKVNFIDKLAKPTIEKTAIVNKFHYDLHGCNRDKTTVTCHMTITNTGRDVMSNLHSGLVYDERGKQYKITSLTIINESGTKVRDFISNVPIEAQFTINNIPKSSTQFSAIKINTNFGLIVYKGIIIK